MKNQKEMIRERLDKEEGTLFNHGRRRVALVYPSPYKVGMASLGFQTIYDRLNALPDTAAERSFLPDDVQLKTKEPLLTFESMSPVSDFPVIAFSVSYEVEITGIFEILSRSGISPLRAERKPSDPLIVVGGPLTFSNPLPLAPFIDVIAMGEGESLLEDWMQISFSGAPRSEVLKLLADKPGFFVPEHHEIGAETETGTGTELPALVSADDASLPARSVIMTPDSVLPSMFLTEVERGCSRGCTFCVMRRSPLGGMRAVAPEKIFAGLPPLEKARRVGLVGAAVSDHPKIQEIVHTLVDEGRELGLSSIRADRLTEEFVADLKRGGYRTLTVASDGATQELRDSLGKKIKEKHLLEAARLAKEVQMRQLKVYMMLGVPGERDEDIDELAEFTLAQVKEAGRTRVALGVAPFVAKKNTPLDGTPFAGIKVVDKRVTRLRKLLRGKAEIRPVSSRWAWVEYELAQGGPKTGLAAYEAWKNGGRFSDWRKALATVESL